jgi:hypothetical protein
MSFYSDCNESTGKSAGTNSEEEVSSDTPKVPTGAGYGPTY